MNQTSEIKGQLNKSFSTLLTANLHLHLPISTMALCSTSNGVSPSPACLSIISLLPLKPTFPCFPVRSDYSFLHSR